MADTVRLTDPLASVINPATAQGLADLGVHTVGQLLRHAPRRYVRRGQVSSERLMPEPGEWITVVGRVTRAEFITMRRRHGKFLKVVVADDRQTYDVSFFNSNYLIKRLKPGTRVMLAGSVKYYNNRIQLAHPAHVPLPDGDVGFEEVTGPDMLAQALGIDPTLVQGDAGTQFLADLDRSILPMYPASQKVQTWQIWATIRDLLSRVEQVPEALSDEQRSERGLITLDDALWKVHLPDVDADVEAAQQRLKFDEAFAMQLVLAQRRAVGRIESAPPCPHVDGGLEDALRERLPFTLTEGQEIVAAEIGDDLAGTSPMSRLLQGEVGSGKTLVALLAMLRVVDNGHQCVLLAPTEVLAAQHHRTILSMLGSLGRAGQLSAADGATAVALLTGSMRTAAKRQVLLDIVTGDAGLVIGTHALLEDHVDFFDLALVVVDEQHRFGVEQRDSLRSKAVEGMSPHHLVMTATPIPRTVAMTVFGDLETSVLMELPRGRQPITTNVVPLGNERWMERAWARAAEEIDKGRQVYVVCSRIGDEESKAKSKGKSRSGGEDEPQTISVLDMYQMLSTGPLADRRIGVLHGRLPADEKAEVMDEFTSGALDLVVSTTVIEVGVDVPNATMMVIIDADRFGVSQLHQLRGRIGRGQWPGLCLLVSGAAEVSQARERLNAVAASTDGFELARVDLEQRREGDVLGELQSGGTSSLHFLSLLDDVEVISDARDLAEQIVAQDLSLANHLGAARLIDDILAPRLEYLDKT
ncbi:ATP-dependent DNA helicase RecG [Gordonia effusa NBRC 100432]|uniref:ATP-dependent DNA helicase RecG n=1 Tax=Gordonia effusa NBRC 100432 TaxID=1077974 RepID=H0QZU4_9ACTN|nr:ATP-dependent DNA helicase RecG [Gordonia effusa]GAB18345.1 ATP-dependent DNA helicase RecG [Gordonia effusa NBRC 100432]